MNEVTRVFSAIERGDQIAADRLLPLVYDELRKLAAGALAKEKPGQTLQATALVHEAYLRLAANSENGCSQWNGRTHFFHAAAEAMRRILIDQARRRGCAKRGGNRKAVPLDAVIVAAPPPGSPAEDLPALDEAIQLLEAEQPEKAQLVKLRYFTGLSLEDAAEVLGVSTATTKRWWIYARAWLYGKLHGD